jgi:hypothetical protein
MQNLQELLRSETVVINIPSRDPSTFLVFYGRNWQTFLYHKSQDGKYFRVTGHMVSQPCYYSRKPTVNNTQTMGMSAFQ